MKMYIYYKTSVKFTYIIKQSGHFIHYQCPGTLNVCNWLNWKDLSWMTWSTSLFPHIYIYYTHKKTPTLKFIHKAPSISPLNVWPIYNQCPWRPINIHLYIYIHTPATRANYGLITCLSSSVGQSMKGLVITDNNRQQETRGSFPMLIISHYHPINSHKTCLLQAHKEQSHLTSPKYLVSLHPIMSHFNVHEPASWFGNL